MSAASMANWGFGRTIAQGTAASRHGHSVQDFAQPCGRPLAGDSGGQIARTTLEIASVALFAATSRRSRRAPSPPRSLSLAKLREHQGDVIVFPRDRPRDAERLIERLVNQASTSVWSASANPGSTSASSGNSRSSDRQKASIVEIAISPTRSFRSRHRARSAADKRSPRAAARRSVPAFRRRPCG